MGEEKKDELIQDEYVLNAEPLTIPAFLGETEGKPGDVVDIKTAYIKVNQFAVPVEDWMIVNQLQDLEARNLETLEQVETFMGDPGVATTIINASTLLGLRVMLANLKDQNSVLAKDIKTRISKHRMMLIHMMESGVVKPSELN